MSAVPGQQHNMRPGGYHNSGGPGPQNTMGTHHGGGGGGGPPQQQPSGPTPTLNQLLQSSGSGGGGGTSMGNGHTGQSNSGTGGTSGANSVSAGHNRYPPTTPYDTNSYPSPHPLKTDNQQYPPPPSGWSPAQQADRQGPQPPHVNNYHPPPQHIVDQQSMYRQGTPPGGPPNRTVSGQQPPPGQGGHQQYYNPPPGMLHSGQYPPQSSHYPPPPGPPAQQGRYPPPPGRPDSAQSQQQQTGHYPGQPQSPHYPPPPSQSPHYPQGQQGPPHPSAQRYPVSRPGENQPYTPPQQSHYPPPHRYSGPPPPMRPGENQPPSHYHPVPSPGMTDSSGHAPPGRPPSASGNSLDGHPPRSTPPPPPSPSLQSQQAPPNQINHHPPSPSQSPRSSQQQLPPPSGPPSHSPSHRPTNNYPPPDIGDVTGCNSNDSASGPIGAGIRPSPSPTGSASSRSMSPAVGNQNIPMPPRPWSGQTDSGPPRIPSDHYRSKIKKADSLNKLYEMDDNPDRRVFLDKLLHFMEELSTPITACPQISKNPLDLYKLYFLVKERGGFLEVTRNKTWKDIAGSLGIGASSSAAYTLRKHYTKHLLPFECKFDRGGIDPQPLINQVEQQTKKKGSKAAPVPSPGSSNSQDSFPGPNSGNNTGSMDSFPGYPSPYGGGPSEYGNAPPPGSSPQQQPRPPPGPQGPPQGPAQTNQTQSPHPGEDKNNVSVSNPFDDMPSANLPASNQNQSSYFLHQSSSQGYQGPPGNYSPYPPPPGGEHYGRGPPPQGHDQYPPQQQYPGGYPPPGRQMYPGYPAPVGGPEQSSTSQQPQVSQQPIPGPDDGHQRYAMGPPPPATAPTGAYPPRTQNYPSNAAPPMNGYSDYYQHSNEQLSSGDILGLAAEEPTELSSLKPTLQGYPPIPGSPPQGAPSPSVGKHMPPPQHMRGMNYPPQPGTPKEGAHPQTGQPYPGPYPPQTQPPQQPPQQRIPPYDQNQGGRTGNYMYPPPPVSTGRESQPIPNRSSPSPSANTIPPPAPHSQTAKQWIPPEGQGWPPNVSNQYPARPYMPPGSGPPQPPHGHPASPASSPIPPSQSPVAPGGPPPAQSGSPQPWASSGPPPGALPPTPRGPMGTPPAVPWGSHSGGTVMSPQPPQTPPGPSQASSQWPQHQRHPHRPPFPPQGGKGAEMYKSGYPPTPPVGMMPPSGPLPSSVPGPKGPPPINQLSSMTPPHQAQHPPTPGVFNAPQPTQFSQLPMAVPIRKEIVFPPDAVESIQPVTTRRRKLTKNDVSPIEPWRIMMCLKSGLLAETTWAFDVLNILLYDDYTITYFSLNFLPGLLDLILEHLRRSLVLMFGQSVGIELPGDMKEESSDEKVERKWYEVRKRKLEQEVDLGIPLRKFDPSNQSRTTVLSGPNYTLKTRSSKQIKFVSRDDDLFVIPGPRDWDVDEKARMAGDGDVPTLNVMDLTRHVVTSFTSDLNIVPIIRLLHSTSDDKKKKSEEKLEECRTEVKEEPSECENSESSSEHLNLQMYQSCETRKATESIFRVIPKNGPAAPISNGLEDSSSSNSSMSRTVNCVLKGKKEKLRLNAVEVEVEENTLIEPPSRRQNGKGPEFLSDNAVMMNGLENESSNQSLTSTTENSSSDFCDSNNTSIKQCTPQETLQSNYENSIPRASHQVTVRDGGGKRKRMDEFEDECFTRDEASLGVVTESQDALAKRCLSTLNILRSLTFVPGNDIELGKSSTFLGLIGKLILLHHDHPLKNNSKSPTTKRKKSKLDEEENGSVGEAILMGVGEQDFVDAAPEDETDENIMAIATAAAAAAATIDSESCTSLNVENHWWWDSLHHIREHVLVMMANISGQVDLSQFSEEISRPILDGLLHWAVCPAAYGQDPVPTIGPHSGSNLSPRRLAIEALCKLSVTQSNVDLVLATPPYSRIERLCQLLSRGLCRTEDQVVREFSINLLSYLSGAESGVARTIALQTPCISLLIAYIEQAEANARNIVETHGFSVLRENPESMGTSLDMLRRAATTLHNLAKHPDNRPLFVQHEPRLLQLVMSQILEQKVAAIVAQVLFTFSAPEGSIHAKYGNSDSDSGELFYTPSLSRSRPMAPHHHHSQPHVIPGQGQGYPTY